MFYTPVNFPPPDKKIKHNEPVITAGSCFADCMGNKFHQNKFDTLPNPFGTVYNPLSLHRHFRMAIKNQLEQPENITEVQGIKLHYDFHSSFGAASYEQLIDKLKTSLNQVHHFMKKSSWMIITWGTAWVYELKDKKEIVANCHKQPSKSFEKFLLKQEDIIKDFNSLYNELKSYNSEIKIIVTVSPVRHTKDTLPLNNVSKSILRTAAFEITEQHKDVYYFPSYEIMIDELRDYRFYKEDMIHPTPQAEDYIWNKFKEAFLEPSTGTFTEQWQEVKKAMAHKPFNPKSEGHQKFIKKTIEKLNQLKDQVNVDKEIESLRKQLE